jgi:hypothetical protein
MTAHVMHIALALGFRVQQEVLRIPSTRNLCVFGRLSGPEATSASSEARSARVEELLRREVGGDVRRAADDWVKEALGLTKAKMSRAGAHGKAQETGTAAEEKRKTKLKELGLEGMDELDLIE